jgi:hypothetical protein
MQQTGTSCQSCSKDDIFPGAILRQIGPEVDFDPTRHHIEDKSLPVKVVRVDLKTGHVHLHWMDDNSFAGEHTVDEMIRCGRYYPCQKHLN